MKLSTAYRLIFPLLIIALTLSTGLLSACSSPQAQHIFDMADMSEMPADVQASPVSVQQAYQFAVANPDVLTELPCYCGCGGMGHTSNYSCYVADQGTDDNLSFDNHALGCSICVDITQDAMRMLNDGKTVPEIRGYVDKTYAKYGPSNMP
jgi:hypothetical protein